MPRSVPMRESDVAGANLWSRIGLRAILVLALALRLWRLTQNGWGNEYYTAGVRSMTTGWSNFLYCSFDPAGFVSVDKPPVALWIQAATVKLFGFHGLSLLAPQVLEGVAAVWVLHHLVRCRFGPWAGLLAALFLAITPVSVAIDRSNNTDSCLVLALLLAAWALIRAAEEGSRRLLLLSMAIIGIGFNVKMLAAFVVLPAFTLVYFLAAPVSLRRRFADLAISGVVLLAVSLAWAVAYDLTPAERRPFAGTTKNNSMLELALGPYAVGRFVPPVKPSETGRNEVTAGQASVAGVKPLTGTESPSQRTPPSRWARLFVQAPAGPLRLADGQLAAQVGWLGPLAVMGLALGGLRSPFRLPLSPERLALLLWFLWAVTYGVVYSFAGGIMHLYYFATMAPPLAALAGIGAVSLWDRYLQRGWGVVLLPTTLLATAAWQLYIEAGALGWKLHATLNPVAVVSGLSQDSRDWLSWLHAALLVGSCVAAGVLLTLLLYQTWSPVRRVVAGGALGAGLLSLLAVPFAWALSSVLAPGHGSLPCADLARLVFADARGAAEFPSWSRFITGDSKLVAFLRANRRDERYLLATSSTRLAAPIIISAGEPVMAMGGFHGLDPILSPEKLAWMVEAKQIRFVMLGDLSIISLRLGAEAAGRPVADWVRTNGKLVDSTFWRAYSDGRSRLELYDLRPGAGLVPAPSY
ncbi:MAG: glycosyltransferase family 39 protein [Deltaproteobacteria bacterium]|nr:glycosyltransferase family 39 protein [Deltaproteobacteria bacterium]